MRVVLPPALERRFHVAWMMVPASVQAQLVRRLSVCVMSRSSYVLKRETDPQNIEGIFESRTCTVWLRSRLARMRRAYAVATILHELAHAVQLLDKDVRPSHLRRERHADGLVTLWLRMADNPLARQALAELEPFVRRDGRPSIHRRL